MYLQVWNGIEINSTTFGRTVEWRGGGVFGNHSGVKAIIIKKITYALLDAQLSGIPGLRKNFPPETFAHENYGQGFNAKLRDENL